MLDMAEAFGCVALLVILTLSAFGMFALFKLI